MISRTGIFKICPVALCAALACGNVFAQEDFDATTEANFLGGTFSMNGLLRVEAAYKTTGKQNTQNHTTNPFNDTPVNRQAGNPVLGWATPLTPSVLNNLLAPTGALGFLGIDLSAGPLQQRGVTNSIGTADTITRPVKTEKPTMNYHLLRFEATPTISWGSDWSLVSRVRAVYDPGQLGYSEFDARDYANINGGIQGGTDQNHRGKPNYMGLSIEGKKNPFLFEWSDKNYMVDLPAFFLQYNSGNLTARLGNQTIAWGQLLFFRVMDTANGLDLRRHLILDRGLEEYADERMSAPGLRLTYQATDTITADAFIQQFRPTVLTNINTPYNVIPSAFFLRDRYYQDNMDEKLNYGIRFKGEFGQYTAQAMYTRRYNQLGAIRWTASQVEKGLPDSNVLGLVFGRYCGLVYGDPGCAKTLSNTAFEVHPTGVFSAEEWFFAATHIRLDGYDATNAVIEEHLSGEDPNFINPNGPTAAQMLFAQNIGHNVEAANNLLDAFFMAGEGLGGHIERKYFAENVFGLGAGYVTEAEPGSIFDQILINVEATYTPERVFTAIELDQDFTKRDEVQIGLVMEKYQRFSTEFPATYMVFQYLWQKRSDLFGLLLDGYGSEGYSDQGVQAVNTVPTNSTPKIVPGVAHANYVVLAALQPFPAYIWELSAAMLIDVQGGVLFQPGIQWKPRGDITVNLFYNYINADAWGGNAHKNTLSLIDFADEVAIRIGYQF